MAIEEAILTGTARLLPDSGQTLQGRAWLLAPQPDVLVDGSGWIPDHAIRDGDGGYIVLGDWKGSQLSGFVELDLSVVNAALPRTGLREQIVDLEVWFAALIGPGEFAPFARLPIYPDVSVELALGQPARWSFSMPYKKSGPLSPHPVTRTVPPMIPALGSPFGHGAISIYGVYLTSTGRKMVRIVRNGNPDSTQFQGAGGASSISVSGGDELSKNADGITAAYSLKAGSGLPMGEIAREIATDAGFAVHQWWTGTTCYSGFQVVNEPTIARLNELADADNYLIQQGPDGGLTAFPEVDTTSPIVMVIGPRDLVLSESVSLEGGANPPTLIELGGQQQVLRDEKGRRTVESIAKGFALYRVRVATNKQDASGNISSTGASAPPKWLMQVSETKTRRTYEGDTLMTQEVEPKGWYNPQVWRYTLDTTTEGVDGMGDYAGYNGGAYFYETAIKNDATPAYKWNRERFTSLGRQVDNNVYDDRGYLVETESVSEGWLLLQEAIKDRGTAGVAFDTINHLGVPILANRIAAKGQSSALAGYRFVGNYGGFTAGGPDMVGRTRTRFEVDNRGYVLSVAKTREGWDAPSGGAGRYLYGDGSMRDLAEFEFIEVEGEQILYYEVGDEARSTTIRTGVNGETLEVYDEPLEGYFPVATRRQDIEPDESIYEGREDLLAQARAASPRETKPIRFDLRSAALETRYPRTVLREEFGLAQDTAHLERRGHALIALHSALTVSFAVPANFLLRPGVRVHLTVPELDIENGVHIVAVSHSRQGRNAPLLTRCQGRIYVA